MSPSPSSLGSVQRARRAANLRAFIEYYRRVEPHNLAHADVMLDSPHPRVPCRYASWSHDGRGYWLDFDDDLAQLARYLAEEVVAEVPWSPIEVIDLDTGQRFPVGVSVTVTHPETAAILVQTPVVGCQVDAGGAGTDA